MIWIVMSVCGDATRNAFEINFTAMSDPVNVACVTSGPENRIKSFQKLNNRDLQYKYSVLTYKTQNNSKIVDARFDALGET